MSSNTQTHIHHLKNSSILAGWIMGLVLISGFVWFFTQPVREHLFITAVNQVLQQGGDNRRLFSPLSYADVNPGAFRLGFWFTMSEGDLAEAQSGTHGFVFLFIAGGTSFPCLAVVTQDFSEVQFIPLSAHGERVIQNLPDEILSLYSRRIIGGQI